MNVSIKKFGFKYLEKSRRWMNDKELCRSFNRHFKFLTLNAQKVWYQKLLKDKTQIIFAIEVDGVYVGNVGLKNIDYQNKKAEYYIFVGDVNFRGKGVGQAATKHFLSYIKKNTGLHKIYLHVEYTNLPAIKLYTKVGFVKEGILHDDICLNQKYVTMIHMAFFID